MKNDDFNISNQQPVNIDGGQFAVDERDEQRSDISFGQQDDAVSDYSVDEQVNEHFKQNIPDYDNDNDNDNRTRLAHTPGQAMRHTFSYVSLQPIQRIVQPILNRAPDARSCITAIAIRQDGCNYPNLLLDADNIIRMQY
ncbi:MAG: hypothetical protein EZS28_022216 [Streblomastix strix]|uniref:Uncharacterized protein n=1 Tax=Streblomastix strix TaxID=222440 RepID=A0A5J4VIM5_9EUKA|nr:MAG: hypothetical protein EZS28_022216 [Streblomastix strix]